jgi:hypothetical protein
MVVRGRRLAGGALLGLGTAIKYWPALLIASAGVHGPRRVFLGGLVAFLVFAGLVPTLVLGSARHADLVVRCVDVAHGTLVDPGREHVTGQSLQTLLYRYLSGNPYRIRGRDEIFHTPHLNLPEHTVALIAAAASLLLLLALFSWLWRQPARDVAEWSLDIGLLIASWLLLSPESRSAQFILLAWPLACWLRVLEKKEIPGRGGVLLLALAGLYLAERLVVSRALIDHDLMGHLKGHGVGAWTLLFFCASLVLVRVLRYRSRHGDSGAESPADHSFGLARE